MRACSIRVRAHITECIALASMSDCYVRLRSGESLLGNAYVRQCGDGSWIQRETTQATQQRLMQLTQLQRLCSTTTTHCCDRMCRLRVDAGQHERPCAAPPLCLCLLRVRLCTHQHAHCTAAAADVLTQRTFEASERRRTRWLTFHLALTHQTMRGEEAQQVHALVVRLASV